MEEEAVLELDDFKSAAGVSGIAQDTGGQQDEDQANVEETEDTETKGEGEEGEGEKEEKEKQKKKPDKPHLVAPKRDLFSPARKWQRVNEMVLKHGEQILFSECPVRRGVLHLFLAPLLPLFSAHQRQHGDDDGALASSAEEGDGGSGCCGIGDGGESDGDELNLRGRGYDEGVTLPKVMVRIGVAWCIGMVLVGVFECLCMLRIVPRVLLLPGFHVLVLWIAFGVIVLVYLSAELMRKMCYILTNERAIVSFLFI